MKKEEFSLSEFAERLKQIIKRDFGKIIDFAKILDESPSYISNYTSGAREPRASFLWKLAKQNIDINFLLTGEPLLDRKELEKWLEKIKAIETELKEVKSRAFDISEENKKLREENEKLKEENYSLRVQTFGINKVADGVERYKIKKGK